MQQRIEEPRHWLEVPAYILRESEVLAKGKALIKVSVRVNFMGNEAEKLLKIT